MVVAICSGILAICSGILAICGGILAICSGITSPSLTFQHREPARHVRQGSHDSCQVLVHLAHLMYVLEVHKLYIGATVVLGILESAAPGPVSDGVGVGPGVYQQDLGRGRGGGKVGVFLVIVLFIVLW